MPFICFGDHLQPNAAALKIREGKFEGRWTDSVGMLNTAVQFDKEAWRSLYSHIGVFVFMFYALCCCCCVFVSSGVVVVCFYFLFLWVCFCF